MRNEFSRPALNDPAREEETLRKRNSQPGKRYRKPLIQPETRKILTSILGGVNNRVRRMKAKITLATHA